MRRERTVGRRELVSRPLHRALGATLSSGERAILLLTRRGAAHSLRCRECAYVLRCPRCATPAAVHGQRDGAGRRPHSAPASASGESPARLVCHYCGSALHIPALCPQCGGTRLRAQGPGTQGLETELRTLFPRTTVFRWDADTVWPPGGPAQVLAAFARGDIAVLVGTQRLLRMPSRVAAPLVGVVDADTGLHLPDFRAAEHVFRSLLAAAALRKARIHGRPTCSYRRASHSTTASAPSCFHGDRRPGLAPPWTRPTSAPCMPVSWRPTVLIGGSWTIRRMAPLVAVAVPASVGQHGRARGDALCHHPAKRRRGAVRSRRRRRRGGGHRPGAGVHSPAARPRTLARAVARPPSPAGRAGLPRSARVDHRHRSDYPAMIFRVARMTGAMSTHFLARSPSGSSRANVMAIRPILTEGHPMLRQKAKKVRRLDASLRRLVDDMLDTNA